MRIIINTATLRFGGAVQGAMSFIMECRYYTKHEYHVFLGIGVSKSIDPTDFPANFHFYYFEYGPVTLFLIPKIDFQLSRIEKKIKPDCVITSSGPSYWHSQAQHLMGFNLGLYIYSESPYHKLKSNREKLRFNIKRRIHFWFFRRDASAFFVQTDDVNSRVQEAFATHKVYTISNTHNGFFNIWSRSKYLLPPKTDEEIRVLTVSAYYKHKNLEIIPLVSLELQKRGYNNVKFIVTLDHKSYESITGGRKSESIINAGIVQPEECPELYDECDIVFLPTLAECFSASYPEAMVMKRPIVTTDLSFAHDICGDAALYFYPLDSVSAADAVEKLLTNKELWNKLVINGSERLNKFNNATERAQKLLMLCEDIASINGVEN